MTLGIEVEHTAARSTPTGAAPATSRAAAAAPPFDALTLLSRPGKLLTGGSVRELVSKFHGIEGLVGLHGGLPPEASFPLASLQFGLADGSTNVVQLSTAALQSSQQYTISAAGYPPLQHWLAAHVQALHAPPGPHSVLVTDGSSHGLELVCSLFLDAGDCLVVEEYTYPQLLECHLVPRGCRILAAPLDEQGIVPHELERVLQEAAAQGAAKPKLLYTVPTGQNPTGAITPLERKAAIYDICRRHGMMIVEDEAYCYLQFPRGPAHPPGLAGLPTRCSYLSLDTDGRVIRLDTFAKFLAPGLRLGWAVAAPAVIDKMTHLLQGQTLGPSGLSQSIVHALLEAWGDDGLDAHLRRLQASYATKAVALHAAAERELAGLAEWQEPRAGMFLWVRLLGVEDATDIMEALKDARVVVVPGRVCHPRAKDPSFRCPYVRLSFSHPSPEQLEEGVRRLGTVLRSLQQQGGGKQ